MDCNLNIELLKIQGLICTENQTEVHGKLKQYGKGKGQLNVSYNDIKHI